MAPANCRNKQTRQWAQFRCLPSFQLEQLKLTQLCCRHIYTYFDIFLVCSTTLASVSSFVTTSLIHRTFSGDSLFTTAISFWLDKSFSRNFTIGCFCRGIPEPFFFYPPPSFRFFLQSQPSSCLSWCRTTAYKSFLHEYFVCPRSRLTSASCTSILYRLCLFKDYPLWR